MVSDTIFPPGRWYQQAVIYQLHVRAFCDSNGDGIGDFPGLTSKLAYLHDLGVTALWLLPFYPSPLKDDGYDTADYTAIHPSYGTMEDFREFLDEAHRLGLRVITELVINHTSDQHPWFQRARHAPAGSPERDFYVWSPTDERYEGVRIIFQDFEKSNWTWDPVAGAYYWHRFYSHQPDLNFESEGVRRAVFEAMDFWLDMGVDGLRLDAIPYLYEREGTNCENLPETHAFLRELRARVDERHGDRMLLAEANQWPEDAVAYFGAGDECHMAFHFPLMPRLFMAVRMEDRFPVIDILQQTPPLPEGAQWAVFLRNHDELTLEMVTDEERDYMYRVYAQDRQARINLGIRRRLAPLLGNDRRRIELMNALLFSLPGTPVLYYGDELGMGDNIYLGDRNGVRTPMQWSPDRNAGFSKASPQRLYLPAVIDLEYHYEAVNVETQLQNQHSLLWWMRRLIGLRKRHPAFGAGGLSFVQAPNPKVLAFLRHHPAGDVLVVANLSRFAQHAELPLQALRGRKVREMFGGATFPPVGDEPYAVTLSPHAFLWLELAPAEAAADGGDAPLPRLASSPWPAPATARDPALLDALARWLPQRRWFAAKARRLHSVEIASALAVPCEGSADAVLLAVRATFAEGEPERYVVPLVATPATNTRGDGALALAAGPDGAELVVHDAASEPAFARALLALIDRAAAIEDDESGLAIAGTPTPAGEGRLGGAPEPRVLRAEQSNTSVAFGDRFVLKLFRRLDEGTNVGSPGTELEFAL